MGVVEDLVAIMEARYGKDVRQAIHDAISDINDVVEGNVDTVQEIANTARTNAIASQSNAENAEAWAKGTKNGTAVSPSDGAYHNNAKYYSEQVGDEAKQAEAWAVGQKSGVDVPSTDPTYHNNAKYWEMQAKYWHDQAQRIAESFSGALRPMGTVTFANLPSVSSAEAGDMYNISNAFVTTSDFVEGAGVQVPLGSNVYLTVNNKWDILAGSPVVGVKGGAESTYRRGNVNITKANINASGVRLGGVVQDVTLSLAGDVLTITTAPVTNS